MAEMEIIQSASPCHQLIRGRKRRRVGEGVKSSEETGRRDGGNHGYKARMGEDDAQLGPRDQGWVRGHGRINGRMSGTVRRQVTCSGRADVCYGLVCGQDLLGPGESVPKPSFAATDEQQRLHSFQGWKREGKKRSGRKMAAWSEL